MHRYLPASGPLFLFGKPRCLARCANLVRQLSKYPYSIQNRSAYKVKHIHKNSVFILGWQTPQPETHPLPIPAHHSPEETGTHSPHVFCMWKSRQIEVYKVTKLLLQDVALGCQLHYWQSWTNEPSSGVKGTWGCLAFHWVMHSPFHHPYSNRH